MSRGAQVPSLWFVEVEDAILTAERRQVSDPQASRRFLADLDLLPISVDGQPPRELQGEVLNLGRARQLTAYDATYFELAQRTGAELATFDRKLADAYRKSGGHVFGDQP